MIADRPPRPPPPPLQSLAFASQRRAEVWLVYSTHEHVIAAMRQAYRVFAASGSADLNWLAAQESAIATYERHAVRHVQSMLRRR